VNYYDRKGQPIDLMTWARKTEDDPEYRIVAQHWVRGWMVSTIWLGLDHSFSFAEAHVPVIFETMIFPPGDEAAEDGIWSERYKERYPTEEAAQAGHDRALAWLVGKLGADSVTDISGPLMETELGDSQ